MDVLAVEQQWIDWQLSHGGFTGSGAIVHLLAVERGWIYWQLSNSETIARLNITNHE